MRERSSWRKSICRWVIQVASPGASLIYHTSITAAAAIQSAGRGRNRRRPLDDPRHDRVAPCGGGLAGEDDLAALDDVEPVGQVGNMVDVGFRDQHAVA